MNDQSILSDFQAPISVSASYDKFYFARRETMRVGLYVIQHTPTPMNGYLYYTIRNILGYTLYTGHSKVEALPGVQCAADLQWTVGDYLPHNIVFLSIRLEKDKRAVYSDVIPFTIATEENPLEPLTALPEATLLVTRAGKHLRITNTGRNTAMDIRVHGNDPQACLMASRNHFTLFSGEITDLLLSDNGKETDITVSGLNVPTITIENS